MIERILPGTVASAETTAEDEPIELFPEEAAHIRQSVPRRQGEFRAVRACARQALAALGHQAVPLLPGERGAPRWPDQVVGSMTHCLGYRAAALAPAAEVLTVGIDAEPNQPLPDGVLEAVARSEELPRLAALTGAHPGLCADRLLFSAKESVYKAWFPLTRLMLDFSEATLTFEPDGTFAARLLVPGPLVAGRRLPGFEGRWLAEDGLVVTAITVLHS
ncbi:4'-phosphopantetheinyl transferase family protein [Saccharothrix sp. ST-888]|uniref:4'-phosphopantetheinyl transferase family protein n=1 Tax=Saccharothrix sp. ST-888 TaxID=1427391 RepID=UPI0005ECC7DC|nr:4'-phosphopantetheinyl transferase superfamily protein [Saccharothrix sp. ST-888]KJK55712.1 4'-phosphopantetheinyl transferase [Saccharothrix sp. ST-888]